MPLAPSGATVRRLTDLAADPAAVWDAIADFGAVHTRVVPGFLTALALDGSDRIVTFATGAVAREAFISRDDTLRRLVYAIPEGPFRSYSAAFEVAAAPAGARVTWTIDLAPASFAGYVGGMMDEALPIMRRMLEPAGRAGAG
ncbi:MAG: SRPBCC family protein [Caulobacter sp.]|nr:SRPBCC family protein [Caulobacter sp.]